MQSENLLAGTSLACNDIIYGFYAHKQEQCETEQFAMAAENDRTWHLNISNFSFRVNPEPD